MTTTDLLAFEREWLNRPQHDGAKMAAVYERFGLSLIGYYQRLVAALGERSAREADPVTCRAVRSRLDRARRGRRGNI